jgi:hypothetical protein
MFSCVYILGLEPNGTCVDDGMQFSYMYLVHTSSPYNKH